MGKLQGVKTFVTHKLLGCGKDLCAICFTGEAYLPAQWIDKEGEFYTTREQAACLPKAKYMTYTKDFPDSVAPSHADRLARHTLSYLNGGGGRGKSTRAIELFRARKALVLTPTYHLAKEMRGRGGKAQTYHSFFRAGPDAAEFIINLLWDALYVAAFKEGISSFEGISSLWQAFGKEALRHEVYDEFVAGKMSKGAIAWTPDRMGQKFVHRIIIWD